MHLYLYLALAISFAHVIVLGPSFVGHPLTQARLVGGVAATAGLVLSYRLGCPLCAACGTGCGSSRSGREGPGRGLGHLLAAVKLDRLPVSGGQFFFWRFLTRDMWWQAHPYSLSALPRPPYLRLTVKGGR